jgi:uracil-DNA glycosylase
MLGRSNRGYERHVPSAPDRPASLDEARRLAESCTACELWRAATGTVFGEGPADAPLMLVGEQPGDQEDRQGRPFVGPAGRVLDEALEQAGVDRRDVYLTNVVKHFKWKARGKRRIHDKPSRLEVRACRPWLDAELGLVQPDVLVLLGATAAQALLGPEFRVTRERGRALESDLAPAVLATVHPSSILRGDPEDREAELAALASDLATAARLLPG